MTKRETYEKKAEELLLPMMEENGFELVDVEYVKEGGSWYLRAYIDKPGGIAINDCELISRALSDKLDEEDLLKIPISWKSALRDLAVPLKKEKDFQRNLGEEVEVRTFRAIEGQKEFTGVLKAYDKESVTIELEETEMKFARTDIALIRQAFDF